MRTFELVVPEGWARIDLTVDPTDAVRAAIQELLAGVPSDRRALARHVIESPLVQTARELADGGAACLLLPLTPVTALPIRPTLVCTPLAVPQGRTAMDVLLALASSDSSAEVMDVNALVALRMTDEIDVTGQVERAAEALAGELEKGALPRSSVIVEPPLGDGTAARLLTRRVRYVIGDPEDNERWVDAFCSVDHLDDADHREVADLALGLVDEIIRTFRWTS